ncbi:MAG: sensor histidine kinase, partial [Lachnospiraceae bacterium]|nr:sensor histidine kinase [Lachnospiraceae bacterium]
RIRQMFLVILDNAIKFSNQNSKVYVNLSGSADYVVTSIKDSGVGIPKEDLETIFDKFYRSKLRQNATGSGLGLTIAKHIALRHDGNIFVESTVGQGSTFTIILPLFKDPDWDFTEEDEDFDNA